jgi:hypothetical protein
MYALSFSPPCRSNKCPTTTFIIYVSFLLETNAETFKKLVYFKDSLNSIDNGVTFLKVIASYCVQKKLKVRSKDREIILELQAAILV